MRQAHNGTALVGSVTESIGFGLAVLPLEKIDQGGNQDFVISMDAPFLERPIQ